LISTVYKGQHVYGKRSRNQKRAPIVRAVPGIVSEAVWQQAQATLQHNYRFGPRHCRHAYLLRGLVKCGLCGLTYIGMTVCGRSGRQESYYRCNGKHDTRGVYGALGQRCPSKDVQTGWLEEVVWEEIEGMLRRPERVLARLRGRLAQGSCGNVESANIKTKPPMKGKPKTKPSPPEARPSLPLVGPAMVAHKSRFSKENE
jgi:site-specific DNA recombinase